MEIGPSFLAAVILGVAYAALPGVVNTEAFRRGIRTGFGPAVLIQTGALLGDAVWAVVALTGAALLLQHELLALALGLTGAGFLFHLARTALVSALHGAPVDASPDRTGSGLLTGAIFSLANPAGLAFWTGMGGGMVGSSGAYSLESAAAFLLAFTAGALLWGVGMAALVAWGRRFATPRLFRVIDAICAAALGYFGLRLLLTTIQRFGRPQALLPRVLG